MLELLSHHYKVEVLVRGPCSHTSFPLKLKSGPIQLECNITIGQASLSVTNTLAYWAHSLVMKKRKCCEYAPGAVFTTLKLTCFCGFYCFGQIQELKLYWHGI